MICLELDVLMVLLMSKEIEDPVSQRAMEMVLQIIVTFVKAVFCTRSVYSTSCVI